MEHPVTLTKENNDQIDRDASGPRWERVRIVAAKPIRLWLMLFTLGSALWVFIHNFSLIFEVLAMLFGALLLMLGLEPGVQRMEKWHIPRSPGVLLLYLLLLAIVLGIGELMLPLFNAEIATLQSQGPALWNSISSSLASTPLIGQLIPSAGDAATVVSQRLSTVVQAVLGTVGSVGNASLDIGIVFVLAYFFVVSKESFLEHLPEWIPSTRSAEMRRISLRVLEGLGRWVRVQPLKILFYAVGFSSGLAILRVPFALAIGLVGGILSIVPILGEFVAALLSVLSALTVTPILALWALLVIVGLTEVQIHLISPVLFGRALQLHPAIVLMATVFGFKAGGLLGLLYSIPFAVVAMVFLDEVRPLWMGKGEAVDT
jgi:predicted PurR-regulated permease PerM